MLLTDTGQASVAVEAKAGEEFDKRLQDWLVSEGESKEQRLAFLCDVLGIFFAPSQTPSSAISSSIALRQRYLRPGAGVSAKR